MPAENAYRLPSTFAFLYAFYDLHIFFLVTGRKSAPSKNKNKRNASETNNSREFPSGGSKGDKTDKMKPLVASPHEDNAKVKAIGISKSDTTPQSKLTKSKTPVGKSGSKSKATQKRKSDGKLSAKKLASQRAIEKISAESTEQSDSDFETSSQVEKVDRVSLDSDSSESEFEEVEEVKPSTSGYNDKLSTSSTSETNSKPAVDLSQVDQKNFDIAMLAKIEGVQLTQEMDSEDSDDDSDWEKVEGKLC